MTRSTFVQLTLILLAAGSLLACSRPRAEEAPPAPAHVEDAPDVNLVTVAHPEQFALAQVTSDRVRAELKASGVVAPDVSRTVPVMSLAGGRVVELRARLGDTVTRGQILLTISSPDVVSARADLHKYRADADLARKALERAKTLNEHEALAVRDLEAAADADAKAQADLHAAEERLQLLGASDTDSAPTISLTAPISGVIVEQNVTGSAGVRSLDNSPNLFTIADLSRVWILCDVYENNLAAVHAGDAADIRLSAYPERALTARVANVGRVLDPATRTAKVRLELANVDGALRPGMFATVTFTSANTREVALVPSSAVLRLHDRDWVFVPAGGQRFRRTEIHTGGVHGAMHEVVSGLKPGDRVAASALQLSGAVQESQ